MSPSPAGDDRPLRVLFVCVENACRSQLAEAFARRLGLEAYSAGSRPSGRVNPRAIAAMAELGYDLSDHLSKGLDELPDVPFDAAVTMGCGDACPHVDAARRHDWDVPDPKHMDVEPFREVRDLVGRRVTALAEELRAGASSEA